MNRLKHLFTFLDTHHIPYQNRSFLIAVSGGMDSMVLAHMFHKANIRFGVAHCNFQLRDKESDHDEDFVKDYYHKLRVNCHVARFDTTSYASENKISIQEAARTLRYHFFEETAVANSYDYIVTAHHLNDNVETMLLNLGSGTGLRGIKGIPPINGKIIRPLLFLPKKNIVSYASAYGIPFRDDSSNTSEKYKRNALRIKVIPELGNIKPGFLEKCASSMNLLHEQLKIYDFIVAQLKKEIVEVGSDQTKVNIRNLLKAPQPFVILYEYLQEFGFRNSQCKEMITAIAKNQSGKLWYSENNEVLLDRDYFFIREKDNSKKIEIVIPEGIENITRHNFEIQIDSLFSKDHTIVKNEEIIVDKDKISFPLLLRPWQDGDFFCPAGMSGKRKKVKSFLTDLKQTRFEKEAVYVLESKGTIVWIISLRQDERFLATGSTENLLRIRIIDKTKR